MISIIICSINKSLLAQVQQNISATIGVEHEYIVIDNRKNEYSIFSAYNQGATTAKFELICFVHEDVCFHTNNWGTLLMIHFKDPQLGLIGACGATVKSQYPSMWVDAPQKYYRSSAFFPGEKHLNKSFSIQDDSEVVVLDGFFLSTRKAIWATYKFNENIGGFHFYDIEFSLRIGKKYKIKVANDIAFEHLSRGKRNEGWIEAAIKFHKMYKQYLPASIKSISKIDQKDIDYAACFSFLKVLLKFNYPKSLVFQYLIKCFNLQPFKRHNLKLLMKVVFNL